MFIKKLTKQVICNPDEPVVSTPDGRLRGLIVDDTYIFRGIKYADAERFMLPTPVKPWEGMKEAIIYGPVCPEIQTVQPDDNYTVPHVFYPQDEDCQYLNVWTQRINDPEAKRPVLVWFHGGGFSTGSGIEHFAYDGENMSRFGDVVVVTLNHRLNVLGYLDLSAYGEKYRYSGNAGNADLVEALRWVKRNISAFGGDPDNVTIFGQSGGGGKVASLLQTPSADGLFQRGVIQSGIGRFGRRRKPEKSMAETLLELFNLQPDQVSELEKMPYWRFQEAFTKLGPGAGMAFGPTRDDDFYLGDIFEVGICAHAKTVPVLVGNVLGEFSQNFVTTVDGTEKNSWDEEKALRILREKFGEDADEAIRLHKAAYPDLPIQNLLFLDRMFRGGTMDYLHARAKAQCSAPTYGFMFRMEQPVYGGTLPWHNAEIPYVFHNADYIEPSYIPGITEKLQDIVCGAWCHFAEKADPNVAGAPAWAPFDEENQAMMYFDEYSYVKSMKAEEELFNFVDSHPIEMTRVVRQKKPKYFGGGPRV